MFGLAAKQDRTLEDVLRVKKSTSQYNNEEDIQATFNSAKSFYASLDSLEIFKADIGKTLVLIRRIVKIINDRRTWINAEFSPKQTPYLVPIDGTISVCYSSSLILRVIEEL